MSFSSARDPDDPGVLDPQRHHSVSRGRAASRRSARTSQPSQLPLPIAPQILQQMEDSCAVDDSDEESDDRHSIADRHGEGDADHVGEEDQDEINVYSRYGRRVSALKDRSESLSLRKHSASMGQAAQLPRAVNELRASSITQRRPSALRRPSDQPESVPEDKPLDIPGDIDEDDKAVATGAVPTISYPPPALPQPLERFTSKDTGRSKGTTTQPPSPEAEQPQDLGKDETELDQGYIASLRGVLILTATCTSQLLDNISMTSVNICLPDISSDLDIVAGQEQWLISGYTITFGGFLLLSGMLADRYGRKLVFNWGMVWFGMWTLINGFAQTKIQLIIFRALQGLGSALTVPSGIGIISNYFKGRDRYRALTIFGSFGAIGFVMGLVLGGIFSHALGWRYVFYISAPFGFATAALGWAVIPKDLEPERPRPALDFIGSFLGCAAMVLLVFVLSSGGEYGWNKGFIIALLVLSVATLGLFVYAEWKVKNPIMPPYLWKQPNFAVVWLTGFIAYGWWQSIVYYICLYAQKVCELSSLDTAARFAVMCPISIFTCIGIGFAIDRFPPKAILFLGLLAMVLAPISAGVMKPETSFWASVFPVAIIGVAAISVVYNVVSILMLAAVPPSAKSLAGGLCNTGFQIGSGVGLAINAAVNSAVFKKWDSPDSIPALVDAYGASMWTCTALGGVALLMSFICIRNIKPMSATQ